VGRLSGGHVWRAALDRLRRELTRAQFDTWLRGTRLTAAGDDGIATLRVRTTFARELLETRYRERIEAAIADVTGQPCQLRIVVGGAQPAEDDDRADEPAQAAAGGQELGEELPVSTDSAPVSRNGRASATAGVAPYAGPMLFESTGGPGDVIRVARGGRGPSLPAARQRLSGGGQRVTPSTRRVREAAERVAGGAPRLNDKQAEESEGAALPEATQDLFSPDQDPVGQPADYEDTADWQGDAGRRQESDGLRMMGGSIDPRGAGGSVPVPRLNARYTFSTFIVGSSNQLAHAASQAVAEAPGQAYNPLFLYGGVGLGKTHLLHAIGHKALQMGLTVLYVSSETFTNEIINAIRYRTQEEFRTKYRSVDVLLVDDIQFIAGKESTEEEFFHTFNTLYENSKQIVICSDRPPKAIVSLEERLRSRFEWGLIADIQPPDLETRVAILRTKADMLGRRVPDDVVTYLASQVHSNIRELEGSFNRLLAYSQLQNLPLTIETAKAALASIASDGRQRRVSVAEVLAAVADYYHIPTDVLQGKQRDKHIVVPRHVAMYLMRLETEASLLEIGQSLGGRDHSTVLHAYDKIAREMNENASLRKEVLAIRQQLLG
jgi:chromosomal replication initiator protein DnaA